MNYIPRIARSRLGGIETRATRCALFTARKRDVKHGPLSHSGEEYVYVLEGEMKYRVGAAEYRLRPGDSLYFDAEDEHDFLPITNHVKYLGLFVERGHRAE